MRSGGRLVDTLYLARTSRTPDTKSAKVDVLLFLLGSVPLQHDPTCVSFCQHCILVKLSKIYQADALNFQMEINSHALLDLHLSYGWDTCGWPHWSGVAGVYRIPQGQTGLRCNALSAHAMSALCTQQTCLMHITVWGISKADISCLISVKHMVVVVVVGAGQGMEVMGV